MDLTVPDHDLISATAHQLYHPYSTAEDVQRINTHYEQPPEFFYLITNGEWNTYSCNLWTASTTTETESQEAKLNLLAQLMDLRPGQRILDVGCGWGGPLVYLCQTYGVQGVGITTSPMQRQAAEARLARYGVDIQIVESHWRDFQDGAGFDAVYTDEVIVHFEDLGAYFKKVHGLLRNGGRMLNKELHLTHERYSKLTRAGAFAHEIYGLTGNYRTLAEELLLTGEAGLEVQTIEQIARSHYKKTTECWIANAQHCRKELEALVGPDYYRRFLTYLKIARHGHSSSRLTLDVVVSHKL